MAKRKAKEILGTYWNNEFPVNAYFIAQMLKLPIKYIPNEQNKLHAGGYILQQNSSPIIYVNRHLTEPKQNFIIAHAIGRYVLNHGSVLLRFELTFTSKFPKEYEANIFAATLLMPDEYAYRVIDKMGCGNTEKVAQVFNVPTQLVNIRIMQLGYDHWRHVG